VVGAAVVGAAVVGADVVEAAVVGAADVAGRAAVGVGLVALAALAGATDDGPAVVGAAVVGASVSGTSVLGGEDSLPHSISVPVSSKHVSGPGSSLLQEIPTTRAVANNRFRMIRMGFPSHEGRIVPESDRKINLLISSRMNVIPVNPRGVHRCFPY
jgi:hypothetical protein